MTTAAHAGVVSKHYLEVGQRVLHGASQERRQLQVERDAIAVEVLVCPLPRVIATLR